MEKFFVSFLSFCCLLITTLSAQKLDCSSKRVQDSLLVHYGDEGADKLDLMYNNPRWGDYFDSIIAICPNVAAAYQLKAIPFIKNGDYAKAFPLEDKAVELDPIQFMGYRAFLKCIFTKDYKGSIIDFQKAEKLTPDGFVMDHSYSFYEGLCNLELKNYVQAEKNLKKDISVQGPGGNVHYNSLLYLGIIYYEMKLDSLAKIYLGRALSIYPQLPEGNYYLAMTYKRAGDRVSMKKYLSLALQSLNDGYKMNEDNLYYAYYPHQINKADVDME